MNFLTILVILQVKADSAEEDGDSEAAQKLAPIDIGDSLPSLILKNEKDEDVEVSTLAAEKGVVFFLVPKADTRKFERIFPASYYLDD